MPMTLKEVCDYQERFDSSYPPEFSYVPGTVVSVEESLEHMLVCVLGEMGEFANLLKKVRRGDSSLREKYDELSKELIDVFIYVVKIANVMQLDLEESYLKKMKLNEERFSGIKRTDFFNHELEDQS